MNNNIAQILVNQLEKTQAPIALNAVNLYRQGNSKGLNEVARNACQSMGINYDDAKKQAMQRLGMNI